MTALELVKETARGLGHSISDDEAGYILWNETGFPCFWDGAPTLCIQRDVTRCFRD